MVTVSPARRWYPRDQSLHFEAMFTAQSRHPIATARVRTRTTRLDFPRNAARRLRRAAAVVHDRASDAANSGTDSQRTATSTAGALPVAALRSTPRRRRTEQEGIRSGCPRRRVLMVGVGALVLAAVALAASPGGAARPVA
jgi:hypothetical protein